ncbi:helix-turn-helix domain-containing protein [Larkinella sp. C7]|uniref:helix-turn-helix domain-containing protein n=1 Tax=Larkinella sp. C7 TaxID=2576607 RepID=UPI001111375E|nr:helix-turn-helix domain-containing protein [Larkinella sp. C7]
MKEIEEQRPRGAPSKYKSEYATIARQLCLLEGSTDRDLAEAFEVSEKTIENWKKQYPEFLRSVQEGKKIADAKVAEAFYKRCIGFDYHEITREGKAPLDSATGSFNKGLLNVTKVVTKHVPPDAGAALNWLKNRQPNH